MRWRHLYQIGARFYLDSMKLGTKLIAAFVAVCMIGAVISAIGIRSLSSLDSEAERLYSNELLGLSYSKEANINLIYVGRSIRNAMLATTAEKRDQSLGDVDKNVALMLSNLDKARPLYYSEKGKVLMTEVQAMLADYRRVLQQLRTKVMESQPEDRIAMSNFMFEVFGPVVNKLDDQLTALADVKSDNAKSTSMRASEVFRDSRNMMLGLLTGGLLMGIGLGVWMARQLTRQLGTEPAIATALAHSVANGDLSVHIALRPGDEHSLMASLKAMRDSLLQVVSNVRQNADGVATASSQIAQGNIDLSSRTEQQASALQQTAASMEELTSTVKQNADNARQANQLAMNASTVAVQGGDVVGEVVQTMKGINDSSKRIADIIGVIDSIAFQTNILALNAAVEAARAGEQGRGFAVVASEVRNLAQRSAEAAKEIKTLISASVERVDQGSALVDRAGTTMQEVVASIRRVTDIMGEISAASVEQSSGVSQIGEAVTQMDRVTQQNAALVEESAAAAESLKMQARKLVEVVSVFKLDSHPSLATG